MLKIVRGAVCAQNTAESISQNASRLIGEILSRNRLENKNVSAIFFTVTRDLDAANPATAVRREFCMDNVAFMCSQEMSVVGMLPFCIRAAVFAETEQSSTLIPVYLGDAAILRPDLS
ncbi:MAG: chorismate mutase [Corallococcus sp.]|nr:chorismate mutase [Corallococcus sp.]MCM1359683.1 chorismate mutase [Corallococcus sp.]MCM1395392.1 chorismate mutase [Corallococcus sp.]